MEPDPCPPPPAPAAASSTCPAPISAPWRRPRPWPADALIFDLEDAVAPDAKRDARTQVVNAVKAGGYGQREIVIRVNGLNTPWGYADLVAAATAGADAILLPKTENVGDPCARRRR